MSEILRESVSKLQPGDVINFPNTMLTPEVAEFEDILALQIEPEPSEEELREWQVRPLLRDLIRPEGVNNTIANIQLVVIGDPYEKLKTIRERGWEIEPNRNLAHATDTTEANIPRYVGFEIIADTLSLGGKTIGQIHAEDYYYPSDWGSKPNSLKSSVHPHVKRIVTKPKYEKNQRIDLSNAVVQIGATALIGVKK